tara:strand:- start:146 stop:553 length:408 start_codon:yes stop_codon:yes gene_type:complete
MSLVNTYLLKSFLDKIKKYEFGIYKIIIEISFLSEFGVEIEDYLFITTRMQLNYINHKIFLKEFNLYFNSIWNINYNFDAMDKIKYFFGVDLYSTVNIIKEKFKMKRDINILSDQSRMLLYYWFDVDLFRLYYLE